MKNTDMPKKPSRYWKFGNSTIDLTKVSGVVEIIEYTEGFRDEQTGQRQRTERKKGYSVYIQGFKDPIDVYNGATPDHSLGYKSFMKAWQEVLDWQDRFEEAILR